MTYFGDVAIPWVVSKDTSISKDIVEKNFVDEPPQVYELTPNLEAGTYSAIFNETVHDKNESFEEQQDAVLSMASRHGTEFPFELGGDAGYVLVNNASTSITPSEEIEEGEIDLRYLDDDTYRSAVKVNPQNPQNSDYNVTPEETLVAFPAFVDVVNETSDFTISTEDSDLDLYIVDSSKVYEYNEDPTDMSKSQRESICRLYNSNDLRLYSDSKVVDNGSYINNSLIRVDYNGESSTIEYYDNGWTSLIDVDLSFDSGYALENSNDKVTLEFVNGYSSSVYRGFSIVEYTFSGKSEFKFIADVSRAGPESYYYGYEHRLGYELVVMRESSDGYWDLFEFTPDTFGIKNLNPSKEYTVYLGVIPPEVNDSDYRRYVYNLGKRSRTFTQV
jgi:hypothetical protein